MNAGVSDGRLQTRRHWGRWVIGLVVALLILALGWVLIRGFGAISELQNVRGSASQLRTALADRALERADHIAPRVAEHAAMAKDLTSDPVWRGFEFVPWLGANFTALREIAEVADSVAADAIEPLGAVAHEIDVTTFGLSGSHISVVPIPALQDGLGPAAATLSDATARAEHIDADAALPPVADAVREMRDLIRSTAGTIGAAQNASVLVPTMLGGSGPRTYLVALQDNASLRSHGGAVRAVMLMRADGGAISLVRTVPARDFAVLDAPLHLDESTTALFGDMPGRSLAEATSIPDFAETGALLAQRWQQQFGDAIDGVVAVDLRTAEHLLDEAGDVSFGPFTADADTIVSVLTRELPSTIPDAAQQDAVFAQAATALMTNALASDAPSSVLDALAEAATEDRIRIWSAHPDEQKRLAASALGGALPADDDDAVHVGVLLNDATGGPLDAYATASIQTAVGVCRGEATTQLTVTWSNDAPTDLSPSDPDLEPGQTRTFVAVYGPEGATVADGGDVVQTRLGTRPVAQHDLLLSPGESTTVTTTFTGDASRAGEHLLRLHRPPMLEDAVVTTGDLDCG